MAMRFWQSFESEITGSVAGGVRSAAEALLVEKPAPGSVQIADVHRAFAIKFGFDLSDVKITAVDVDLVFLFPDGSRLVLPGLALNLLSADPPHVSFKDEVIEPAAMFSKLGDIKLVDNVLATSLTSGGEPDKTGESNSQGNSEATSPQRTIPMPSLGGTGTGQTADGNIKIATPQSLSISQVAAEPIKDATPVAPSATSKASRNSSDAAPIALTNLEATSSVRLFGVTEAPESRAEGQGWIITNGFAAKPADTDPSFVAQTKRMEVLGTARSDVLQAADFTLVKPGETIRRIELSATPTSVENKFASSIKLNLPAEFRVNGMNPAKGADGKDYYEFPTNGKNTIVFDLVYQLPAIGEKLTESGIYGMPKIVNFQMIIPEGAGKSIYYGSQTFVIAPRSEDGPRDIRINGVSAAVLWSNPPDVSLSAGDGDDTIVASASADLIDGGAGQDIVSYSQSNAAVRVSLGEIGKGGYAEGDRYLNLEAVEGSAFADHLTGNSQNNKLIGGAGADTLDGGEGQDTVEYTRSQIAVAIDLNSTQQSGGDAQGDVLFSIEHVIGSVYGDLLIGNGVDNRLIGQAGDDTLRGGHGADTLDGGAGRDTADFSDLGEDGSVSVTLIGDRSVQAEIVRNGVSEIDTLIGIEHVIGGKGDDRLTGDGSANILIGGGGSDIISGAAGNDTLDGGDGKDTASYGYLGVTQRLALDLSQNETVFATVFGALDAIAEVDELRSIENIISGAGADTIIGSQTANKIDGGAGGDLIIGSGGDDTLDGGVGIDTVSYRFLTNGQNLALTLAQDGVSIGRVLRNDHALIIQDQVLNFENVEGGKGNDSITGNASENSLSGAEGDDLLSGGAGNDTLNGGAGQDVLRGGLGDDVYIIDTRDFVDENSGEGIDTVFIDATYDSQTYSLNQNLEKIDASFAQRAMMLNGNSDNNTIVGSDNDDTLDGGGNDDSLAGGKGNDSFIANLGNDTFVGGAGFDTLDYNQTPATSRVEMEYTNDGRLIAKTISASGTLIEIDTLIDIESIIGSNGNDVLIGTSSAVTLRGGAGDDTLQGGSGIDYLSGGSGNDVYRIDALDTIHEEANSGIDTVEIGSYYGGNRYTLATNLEIVRATSAVQAMNLVGNALNNTVIGSAFADTLEGQQGDDLYELGDGDIAIELADQGNDTVRLTDGYTKNNHTLADHAEILDARTYTRDMVLLGNATANTILAGAGNDALFGGGGNDLLNGGAGIDTADFSLITNPSVGITVNLSEGRATIGTSGEIDTLVGIENLTGGAGHDSLIGDNFANVLVGGAGNDTLDGDGGIDTVSYATLNHNQRVNVDLSDTDASGYATALISGSAEEIDYLKNIEIVIGGDGDDAIRGSNIANTIIGGAGNDTIEGGGGADSLDGGAGTNTLSYLRQTSGLSVDPTFSSAIGWTNGPDMEFSSGKLRNALPEGALTLVTVNNLSIGKTYQFSFDYYQQQGVGIWAYLPSGIGQNLNFNGSSGTFFGEFTATDANNLSFTLAALNNVRFIGHIDNFYIVDTSLAGVTVNLKNGQASGGDAQGDVFSNFANLIGSRFSDNLIGDDQANAIYGDLGNDTLDGGSGVDTLIGGFGDDLYLIDEFDEIQESANFGRDTAKLKSSFGNTTYTLAGNVEDLDATLLNSGTARAMRLIGNSGNNRITGTQWNDTLEGEAGHDTLDGGHGNDSLLGGSGNDVFVASLGTDTFIGGEGNDTADYSALQGGPYTISMNRDGTQIKVEVYNSSGLVKTDTLSSIETIIGTNGIDRITGDDSDNRLIANGGNDTVFGEAGNDTLDGGDGHDALDGGAGADSLDGGLGNDSLIGGSGNDTLNGGAGDDVLTDDSLASLESALMMRYRFEEGQGRESQNDLGGAAATIGAGPTWTSNPSFGGSGLQFTGGVNDTQRVTLPAMTIGGGAMTFAIVARFDRPQNQSVAWERLFDFGNGPGQQNIFFGRHADSNQLIFQIWNGTGQSTAIFGSIPNAQTALYTISIASDGNVTIYQNKELIHTAQMVVPAAVLRTQNYLGESNWPDNSLSGAVFDFRLFNRALSTGEVGQLFDSYNSMGQMGAGHDSFFGGIGNDTLLGGLGDDTLDGGEDTDSASYITATSAVTVSLLAAGPQNTGGAGNDTLLNIENLIGSHFADHLTGDNQANRLTGGFGNDTLIGGLGNDTLDGGGGADWADYSSRTMPIVINLNLAQNNATIDGSEIDTLISIENIRGGSGNDTITGDGNANLIEGNGGIDSLAGGAGNDTLIGGWGNDILDGGDHIDTLDYSTRTQHVIASLSSGSVVISGGDNETDYISNFEIVVGGSGNDSLQGDSKNNTLIGGAGNDTISGGSGNDSLNGGSGINTLDYSYLTTNLTMTLADIGAMTTVTAAAGTDVDSVENFDHIILGAGNDSVSGNNADNSIVGGSGNDTLDGAGGNDTLDGGIGNDSLVGGAGNDILIASAGNDTFVGGAGFDTLSYSGLAPGWRVVFSLDNNGNQIARIFNSSNIEVETDNLREIETIIGSDGNDAIVGDTTSDSLLGGNGNDTVDGGTGQAIDTLDGGSGTNTLSYFNASGTVNVNLGTGSVTGAAGNDVISNFQNLIGSNFADVLTGGATANSIDGGQGDDWLVGDLGNDTLNGGEGQDTVDYSSRTTTVTISLSDGGNGTASISGGVSEIDTLSNIENIVGGSANDVITIAATTSTIANRLEGRGGNDNMSAGAGNDTLIGGAGDDTLDGGADNDLVVFSGSMSDYTISIGASGNLIVQDNIANRDGVDTLTNFEQIQFVEGIRLVSTLGNASGTLNQAASSSAVLAASGNGNDSITTGKWNDSIVSGSGNDFIVSGAGDDSVFGGDGNDTIIGGPGADRLDGGAGNDTLSYQTRQYSNGAWNDFTTSEGWLFGSGVSHGTNAANVVNVTGTAGAPVTLLSLHLPAAGLYGFSITLTNSSANAVTLSLQGQTINLPANVTNRWFSGGFHLAEPGHVTLSVTSGTFTGSVTQLSMARGVFVNLADNSVSGGDAHSDVISNFESVIGSVGADTIIGNDGNNRLETNTNGLGDSIEGRGGNDTILGSASNDNLNGGQGNDFLDGSSSGDNFQFDWSMASGQGWGQDTITGIELSADKIVIRNLGMSIVSPADFNELFSVTPFNGTALSALNPMNITLKGLLALGDVQTIAVHGMSNGALRTLDINDFTLNKDPNITWIAGTSAANTLSGTSGNDTIVALAGDDSINASLGNDIIDGGSGNDTLNYTNFNTGTGIAINLGTTTAQTITTGVTQTLLGIEAVVGTAFADQITGGVGNDTLTGWGGDDVINGGSGTDLVVFRGNMSEYEFSIDGNNRLIVRDTIANRDGTDTLAEIERITFSNIANRPVYWGNGYVSGAGLSFLALVVGGAGNDELSGGNGADWLVGNEGHDVLLGHDSNDTMLGGDGDDTLIGGAGADSLDGGTGNNTLTYATTQYAANTHGTFDFPGGWSWNPTMGVGSGVLSNFAGQSATGTLISGGGVTFVNGVSYNFSVDVNNATAGTLQFTLGGQTFSVAPGLATYTGSFIGTGSQFALSTNAAFAGTIDNLVMLDVTKGVTVNLNTGVATGGDADGDVIRNIQNLVGSVGHDTLTGDSNTNRLDGWLGNDTLNGGGSGIDSLIGGSGNDTMILDVLQLTNGSRVDGGLNFDMFQFAAKGTATASNVTLADLNTLLDNTEQLDFTGANNQINLSVDLASGSADRVALDGITGNQPMSIRYNVTGTNDLDSISVTNAAASDASGTAGAAGYTQNYYADVEKTQLLLKLIAA